MVEGDESGDEESESSDAEWGESSQAEIVNAREPSPSMPMTRSGANRWRLQDSTQALPISRIPFVNGMRPDDFGLLVNSRTAVEWEEPANQSRGNDPAGRDYQEDAGGAGIDGERPDVGVAIMRYTFPSANPGRTSGPSVESPGRRHRVSSGARREARRKFMTDALESEGYVFTGFRIV